MNIKDRINSFIDYLGITIKAFEINCGMSNGYISSIRKGLGVEKLENVLLKYPQLNRDWLLYGEGEMLKTEKKNDIGEEKIQSQALDTDQIEMIKVMQANMTTLFNTVDRQNKTIDNLTDTITRQNETISDLTATVTKQNETISNQQKQIAEMETKKERQSSGTVAHATTHHVGGIQK